MKHRYGRSGLASVVLAMAVAMAFGAGVSFAKTETTSATYYEDSLNDLCVGVPTEGLFAGSCEWQGMAGEFGNGYNVGVGFGVLKNDTTGTNNVAIGFDAMVRNTTGHFNVASGYKSLGKNSTGSSNVASGLGSLESNTEGSNNVAIGGGALFHNATGIDNVAIGDNAGLNVTTGSNNIEISNEGVAGEAATTRIGHEGRLGQTRAFIAGVYGKTLAGTTCNVDVNEEGQLGCTAGATSFEFSTGGANLANNHFVGLGSVNGNEGMVQQSVAPSGTLTKMTCFQNGTASVAVTYTLRDNSASTTLTCTVAAGSTRGVGTGSVAFASGDLLNVKTPAASTPGKPGSFSVSTG